MAFSSSKLKTRRALLFMGAAGLAAACAGPAQAQSLTVYKTPWCGCCTAWADHMKKAGFAVTFVEREDLAPLRARYGVPDALASCHTAVIGGYVVEGHVPAADVQRLLKERPKARGLAVPAMPIGSPGMESPDGTREAYQTLLLADDGVRVFSKHN